MKKIIITIIFTILLGVCGSAFIEASRLNVNEVKGFECDETLGTLDITDVEGYSVKGDKFYADEDDPRFYLINFYMKVESLKIVLSEPLEKNTCIELYYTDKSIVKYGHKGETEIYIDTDGSQLCSAFRIDINGDFSFDRVELSRSDYFLVQTGKSEISIWAYVTAWIFAIAISLGVVYGCRIVDKIETVFSNLKNKGKKFWSTGETIYKLIVTLLYIAGIMAIWLLVVDFNMKLTAVTVVTILFSIYFNIFSVYKNIAGIVFVTIMMSGICYIYTLPVATLISFDDEIHYENSVKLSHLFEDCVTEADEFVYGRRVTEKFDQSIKSDELENLEELYDVGAVQKGSGVTTASYKTLSYLPAAIGMFLARGLDCSFVGVFYAGKLGNLFVYALLIYFAIKRLRSGKLMLTVISLIPLNIFLAASYDYDIWLTGWVMFATAYIIGVIQDKTKGAQVSAKDIILILLSFTIGFAPKAVYFPLFLLIFMIPRDAYKNKKTFMGMCAIACICILFVLMTFMLPFVVKGPGEGDARGGEDVNSSKQVSYILENPLEYTETLLNHIVSYVNPENQLGTVGGLGYMGTTGHFVLIMLMFAMVAFADRDHTDVIANSWKVKIWSVLSIFAAIVLISTALYVSFTPVGLHVINGCQSRYLIPLIFPFLYFVCNVKTDNRNMNKSLFAVICVLTMAFIAYSDAWELWISQYIK